MNEETTGVVNLKKIVLLLPSPPREQVTTLATLNVKNFKKFTIYLGRKKIFFGRYLMPFFPFPFSKQMMCPKLQSKSLELKV